MRIERHRHGSEVDKWLSFCLDKLEEAKCFRKGLGWNTELVPGLIIEEIVGALVAAEHHLESLAIDDD